MLRVTLSDNSVPDLGFSSDPLLSTLRFQSVDHARHCCSARTWQSDLNLGGKNMQKPLELVSYYSYHHYLPLNIFQHEMIPLQWSLSPQNMAVPYPSHGAHHLRWQQQLLGWCHATATAHWDPPPYFPNWWPRATNAWQIWQMHLEKKDIGKTCNNLTKSWL